MRWLGTVVTGTLLALMAYAPVAAQDEALTPEEQSWLEGLVQSKFSGGAGANGFSIKARAHPLMADEVVGVVDKADELTEEQSNALEDVIRFEVPAEGWVDNFAVTKGEYRVGLAKGPHNLQMVTRDADGNVVNVDGWYLNSGTQAHPETVMLQAGGTTTGMVSWGNITFDWKYNRRSDHDEKIGDVDTYTSGNVAIHSDLPEEAGIQEIAELAARAVKVNDELFERPFPEGKRYELYLLQDKERFQDIDGLLTGGSFKDHGAMTSWRTGLSYIRWWPHWDGDYFQCSDLLALVFHELHHQYTYRVFPSVRYAPTWLVESLAECAAQQGLDRVASEMGRTYEGRRRTEYDFYRRAGMTPTSSDIVADVRWGNISAYYASMWHLGHKLVEQREDMRALFNTAAQCQLVSVSDQQVRREFDGRYPPVSELIAAHAGEPDGLVPRHGSVDRKGDVVQYNSPVGAGGYAMINERVAGNSLTLSGEFRWDHEPVPQADFFFAYTCTTWTESGLQVAVTPSRIVVFRGEEGDWSELLRVEYDEPMNVFEDGEPVWHEIEIRFNALEQTIRVDTTGGRWAQFDLADYYGVRDTYCGIGCHDGVAWFRNLKIE